MVKVDTAPDEDVRENEPDSLDPGQQHYNEEFNKIGQAETDRDFDQIIDDNYGDGTGDETTLQGDKVPRNFNSDAAAANASEDVKDQEENPDFMPGGDNGPKKGMGKFGKLFRKGGASGGIIGLVVAAGSITTILGAPAALLVAVERILTNNGTHDTRANTTMARARIGAVFSSAKESVCSSKIKCKVASMSSKEIKAWKSIPGVQIEEGRTAFGRKMISSMTIEQPNGKPLKITTPGQFQDALQNNEHFRTLYARSTASKASTFIGPDSKVKTIANKYKMKMSSPWRALKTKVGETKEQASKAINEALSKATQQAIGESGKERVARIKTKISSVTERVKTSAGGKAIKAAGNVAGLSSIGCTLYSMQKATLTAIKLSYYTDLIRFFLPFVQLANDIQSNEAIDPAVVSEIGDKYTWYQPAGANLTPEQTEKIGLTATDSQGFQAALYGDFGKLQDFTKHYAPWYAISLASASGFLKSVEDAAPGGKKGIHNFCVGAKYLAYVGILTGGWIGGALYAACKAADWIASDACSEEIAKAFQAIIDQGMDDVYKEIENFALGADLKGVDLGNALAAGIGLFLMEKSRGSGLKPAATTAAVSTFLSSTEGNYQLNVQTQKDVAKTTPFDITNQYSFISNLTTMFSQYKAEQTTGFSVLANLMSVTSSSFALAAGTANAGYFQPIESVDRADSLQSMTAAGTPGGRSCQDIDMTDVGIICDWTGRSIDVLDSQTLEWGKQMQDGDVTPWNDTIDYMANGEGPEKNKDNKGYIDGETGEPDGYGDYNSTPDPDSYEEKKYDNPYLMWKAYCTNDRIYPLGTTMKSVDDDDSTFERMGWFTGSKCAGNDIEGKHIGSDFDTMLDRFFFYYNMCETQLGVADGNQKCWDDEGATDAAGAGESLKSDGEWGCPVDPNKGGIMTQKPHDIGNGTASGVDYNYGKDTPGPIYAVRDGVVTQAGPASGYGNWVMIEHDENGKKVSSYYGHIANGGYFVKVGQKVKKGDHIADIGAGIVGSSTGAHVHAGLKMDPQATAQDYETRFMAACKK